MQAAQSRLCANHDTHWAEIGVATITRLRAAHAMTYSQQLQQLWLRAAESGVDSPLMKIGVAAPDSA